MERERFAQQCAERMRKFPTPAEEALRDLLRPLGFEFQVPISGYTKNGGPWGYIADAFHSGARLIVEADGGIHKRTKGRDRRRGQRLACEGFRTLRFSNRRVLTDGAAVVAEIKEAMEGCG